MTTYAVTVLHNVSGDTFWRYDPATSKLFHAHTFQVIADSAQQAANLTWVLANVDGPEALPSHLLLYDNQVILYRERMNRSLSMGDVLVIHEFVDEEDRFVGSYELLATGHKVHSEVPDYERSGPNSDTSASFKAHQERWSPGHQPI